MSISQIDYPCQAMFGNKTCGADCDMDGVCPIPYPGATMGKCNGKGECLLDLSNLGCKGNIVFSLDNVITKILKRALTILLSLCLFSN